MLNSLFLNFLQGIFFKFSLYNTTAFIDCKTLILCGVDQNESVKSTGTMTVQDLRGRGEDRGEDMWRHTPRHVCGGQQEVL